MLRSCLSSPSIVPLPTDHTQNKENTVNYKRQNGMYRFLFPFDFLPLRPPVPAPTVPSPNQSHSLTRDIPTEDKSVCIDSPFRFIVTIGFLPFFSLYSSFSSPTLHTQQGKRDNLQRTKPHGSIPHFLTMVFLPHLSIYSSSTTPISHTHKTKRIQMSCCRQKCFYLFLLGGHAKQELISLVTT